MRLQAKVFGILTVTLPLLSSAIAFAYGDVGHLTVCEIAWQRVSDKTKSALEPVLGGRSFAEQCVWPDEVKRIPQWKPSSGYHFVNIETMIGEQDATGAHPPATWDDPREFAKGGDLLQELVAARAALSDSKRPLPARCPPICICFGTISSSIPR
jgi:hypothetical protein